MRTLTRFKSRTGRLTRLLALAATLVVMLGAPAVTSATTASATTASATYSLARTGSSVPGGACLDCLACPNAVATRRHLPRPAWPHRALDELRATVPPAAWERDWQAHILRLSTLLEDNTTAAERQAAVLAVGDADRELIAGLLSGRYSP